MSTHDSATRQNLPLLEPAWPHDGVRACMTLRQGGSSAPPYASMNLGTAVGDDPQSVQVNRARLQAAIGAEPRYLRQVHGTRVVRLFASAMNEAGEIPDADASFTTEPGIACTVLSADCLPVLLAAPDRRGVAAAHAGWRGLQQGVVEAAVQALCAATGCAPGDLRAWLGACIGPEDFQVGADVLRAFGGEPGCAHPRFVPDSVEGRWLADLPGLTQDRLRAAGVVHISGGSWSTVADASRFFSYRRDGVTGRMAACIWIER